MSGTKNVGEKQEVELTREAKEAIRSYMLSLIALPAFFLTVISAAGGFFLNKIAFQDGYNEAYKTAISDVVTAAKDVGIAKSNANDALKNMNDAIKDGLAKLAVSLQDAAKVSEDSKLTSQKASALINSDINGLAVTLAKTEAFQRAADNVLIPGFAALGRDVADAGLRLKVLSDFRERMMERPLVQVAEYESAPDPAHFNDPPYMLIWKDCPVGSFVSGAAARHNTVVPKEAGVSLTSILIHCSKLPM